MRVDDLNRRTVLQALVAGGSAALLTGCAASSPPAAAPTASGTGSGTGSPAGISITDQRGKTVTFTQPVTKVVTIPMPAASLLVAVDRSADHLSAMHNASWVAMRDGIMGTMFPRALELPHDIATQDFTPNVESVRALNPDVVIQWSDAQLIEPLENAGLTVIGLTNTGKQEDVDAWVTMFAAMLGKPERATQIKARSDHELDDIKALAASRGSSGPSILYFNRFTGGLKAAAANTYNDFYIKLVGGTNPATGEDPLPGTGMVGLDVEQVLKLGPRGHPAGQLRRCHAPGHLLGPGVAGHRRCPRAGRVYKVPLGGYRWDPPGQESPLMWHWLSDIAYPRTQSGLRAKVREYFRFLYDHEVTDDELNRILWTEANAGSAHYQQFNAA